MAALKNTRLALLALLLSCTLPAALAQARFAFEDTRTVLPKTVRPSHYTLSLQLDPQRQRFGGRAEIELVVRERVPAIVLHARALDATRLELHSGAQRRPLRLTADDRTHTWRLTPADGRPIAVRARAGAPGLGRAHRRRPGGATPARRADRVAGAGGR